MFEISLAVAAGLDEKKTGDEKDPQKKKEVPQVRKEKLLGQAEAGAAGRQEREQVEPLAKAVAGKQKQVGERQQT